jgi:hypothetical protein
LLSVIALTLTPAEASEPIGTVWKTTWRAL